jgi:hypothetical protein
MYRDVLKDLFGKHLQTILNLIDEFIPIKRKYKVTTKTCFESVCRVLVTGIKWSDLEYFIKDCHYTTIYKRFCLWSKHNIFEKIWNSYINLYCASKTASCFKTLFIDSSMVTNHYGSDCIGYNHFDRHRKATKVSIICDDNKVPLSISFFKANVNDQKTINETLNALKCKIKPNNRHSNILVGDKGYIVNPKTKNELLKNNRIRLVTPFRKNQKAKNTKKDKEILSKRYKIEHIFLRLDKFSRIHYRKERKVDQFQAFHFIALISMLIPKLP